MTFAPASRYSSCGARRHGNRPVKIAAGRIEAFLRRPDAAAVLVYGPDQGLVRERADALVAAVADDPADPFAVAELNGRTVAEDPASLADEVAALSFSGGRRVVRVRDGGDPLAAVFEGLLDPPGDGAFVVVEAGVLGKRSSLRRLFEGAAGAAAVPCYGDHGFGLEAVIVETLKPFDLEPTADALAYLAANLGSDRGVTRRELEKLALYKGGPGSVGLEDALACVGDSAAASMDGLAHAVAAGDLGGVEGALRRAFSEGASEIAILRAVAGHFRRLHLATGLIAAGRTPDQAMAALKPAVFFKLKESFRATLRQWTGGRLARALEMLTEAELDCKTTGLPATALCGRALMRIAQAARRTPRGRAAGP